MATGQFITVGRVGALWRYPVKSTLGEEVGPVDVDEAGLRGDRRFGVVDTGTALVASAKRPHRWRGLLQLRSELAGSELVRIRFPDVRSALSTDDAVDKLLSEFLGEEVELRSQAPPAATPERAVPEDVLAEGPAADSVSRPWVPLRQNFVPIPIEGFGSAPSLGVYAAIVTGGRLSPGDEVRLGG